MSRWKLEEPSEATLRMREWVEGTNKGQAYKIRQAKYARDWRLKNPEKAKAGRDRANVKRKLECLTHYSKDGIPQCACCGEKEIVFLQLDHINDDGAEHRRQVTKELGYFPTGTGMANWLKKNDWPPIMQVLCANCNWGKRLGKNGACPHEAARIAAKTDINEYYRQLAGWPV